MPFLGLPSHSFFAMQDFFPHIAGNRHVGLESSTMQPHGDPCRCKSHPRRDPIARVANTTWRWWRGNGRQARPDTCYSERLLGSGRLIDSAPLCRPEGVLTRPEPRSSQSGGACSTEVPLGQELPVPQSSPQALGRRRAERGLSLPWLVPLMFGVSLGVGLLRPTELSLACQMVCMSAAFEPLADWENQSGS